MSETIDNAKLLEMNYNSQLDALREIGMLSDGEVIGLGEIADYMKWAGGLLDVQLAKADKSDGKLVLFKTEEWDALSSNQQGNYLTVGVRVRADGKDFLVSKDNIKTSSGTYTMKWSEENVNVTGLKDYGDGSTGIYDDFDAVGMTDAICSFAELRGVEYLPGQLSRAYKACTAEVDGVDDPVVWSCATLAHLLILCKYRTQINEVISTYIGSSFILAPERYWAANEYNNWYAYYIHLGSGMVNNNNNKNNNPYRVRAVSAMQPVIYDIPFSSIVEAYRDCLSNKRGTNSYTKFTVSYEGQLVWLWERIRTRTYKPGYSYTFIVDYPVTREIFAASFIDRVVHHFIALRIEPILESLFVDQGDVSKNCRKGQGNLKMVREVYDMIREESEGYTCDAYIFKGDFANFFMSIDKSVLWEMIDDFVRSNYDGDDIDCLLYLLSVTIFHCPQDRCIRKSPISAWKPLPNRKSLFYTERSKGMAIGNLPSQLLANFIASAFDQWIAHKGFRHYRRFCDDFVVVCKDKERLLRLVPQIDRYLDEQLHMALHPNKRYIQHYTKGVKMVGAVIKPWRIYISNRTVGKFYDKISRFNAAADDGLQERYVEKFVQTINSYLGMMVHYNTYNRRKHICNDLILPKWAGFLYFCKGWKKARVVGKYKTVNKTRKAIRKGSLSFAPELGANHKSKGK